MSKEALKERVQFTFDKNPNYEALFSTSDNNVFTDANLAEQHAIRLKDTTIETHKREAGKDVKTLEVVTEEVKDEEVAAEEVKAPKTKK